jgi:murein DD-endopeptidase MepM/ murein hydrolase activator NlpD
MNGRRPPSPLLDDATAPPPGPNRIRGLLARLFLLFLLVRGAIVTALALAAFVVVTSLAGGAVESTRALVALGLIFAVLLPWAVRGRLRRVAARRFRCSPRLGGVWFFALWNVLLLAGLGLGFSDSTGRALRRRGDWFLGEADGVLPRRCRAFLARASAALERYDLSEEERIALDDALRPQDGAARSPYFAAPRRPLPGQPAAATAPAAAPGSPPPSPAALPVPAQAWFHPLSGPTRHLPPNAACRFGASRPGTRPPECELGHCGVDLARPVGTPIFAVHDGTVLTAVRDEVAGGTAGRFLRIGHREGAVVTSYIHLDEIRPDLRPGMRVKGGEVIGTIGLTGVKRSGPHLHFAVAVRRGGGSFRYVDPEPMLWFWRIPSKAGPPAIETVAASYDG